MQLLATDEFYFIKSVRTILKCCRSTANISVFQHSDLAVLEDFELLGDVFAFIGKITVENISYLLLITECTEMARIGVQNAASIWRVDKVCALPVLTDGLIHKRLFDVTALDHLEKLKNQPKKFVKLISHKVPMRNLPTSPKLIEEIVAFLNQPNSFYFASNYDITRTLQSHCVCQDISDERFFWNRDLLKEFFVRDGSPIPAFKEWITPLIYGYVDQQSIKFEANTDATMTLISRRSVKRAGVRYLRRGIDECGDVANFVESEFIVSVFGHSLSFVQCRGSIPIFWSQKGYQLKPPLVIEKPLEESLPAFSIHIKQLLSIYASPLVLVNLVDQTGREASLGEAYLQHVLALDCHQLAYHSFDFHRVCGNRRHYRLQELIDTLAASIASIGFCWMDKCGQLVLRQKGIIRTNCVDCLDRTNVVQSSICQAICLIQCRKLGIVEPVSDAPEPLVRLLQRMWADHGDFISKQYAGTSALKGDITRNGQRKFTGMVKDGYNSASRYYLSQLCDANRQRVIDAVLGLTIPAETLKGQ